MSLSLAKGTKKKENYTKYIVPKEQKMKEKQTPTSTKPTKKFSKCCIFHMVVYRCRVNVFVVVAK